jgi:hypothetical protein
MVKIRYAELPAGLHVATEAFNGCTIVYLKPGLTRPQRKDALTVARRSARFGHGPSLPALDMAFALAADRTRTMAQITTSVMRKHPLLLLPVLALVLGIIAAGMLASAAIVTTLPPSVSSAPPGGLYEFNIGQLVNTGGSTGPGSSSGTPGSATPRGAGSTPGHPTSNGGARHRRAHGRAHVLASMQRPVAVRARQVAPVPGAAV